MGWFRRRQDNPYGYEDRAALKGFGGYEPSEPTSPTYGVPQVPTPPTPTPTSGSPSTSSTPSYGDVPPFPERPDETPEQLPSEQPPRRRKRTGLMGFLSVLMVFVVTWLGSQVQGDDDGADVSPGEELPTTAPSPETRVVVPVEVDGWQSVVQSDGDYAYDVPPDWVPKPDVLHGWESEDDSSFTLATSAFVGEGYCADDADRQRGGSGLTVAEGRDGDTIAADTVRRFAEAAYKSDAGTDPEVTVKPPETVEVSFGSGQRQASLVLADVVVHDDGDGCFPDTALVGALAVETSSDKAVVFVAYDGQDAPDASSEEELTQLLTSLRVPEEDELTTTVVVPIP
ncbi:hypothetical protein [Saccharomonospora sp.]|uniref:hypothetical protein n=1 Tax=Saccharomonospora sp. TaxID=33913 RepID=UPI00262CBEDF|nr:hypothetical protein [Saccharomonospora sp.]